MRLARSRENEGALSPRYDSEETCHCMSDEKNAAWETWEFQEPVEGPVVLDRIPEARVSWCWRWNVSSTAEDQPSWFAEAVVVVAAAVARFLKPLEVGSCRCWLARTANRDTSKRLLVLVAAGHYDCVRSDSRYLD